MAITILTRWKTPNVSASTEVAKRAKAMWKRHGALDVRLSQIYTGPQTGQYIFVVVFADMVAYAKAQSNAATDNELQQLNAENTTIGAAMQEREILVGIDI
jgi:hypothetical protein